MADRSNSMSASKRNRDRVLLAVTRSVPISFEGAIAILSAQNPHGGATPMADSSHAVDDSTILIRFKPPSTVSANLATLGSSKGRSTVHSQKEAMSAARSTESRESARPDSIMGMSAAAALRRLISGVEGGGFLDISSF